jgi:hypothetical protein
MSWLRLDDKFAQHPKVADLSDKAFRVHIEVMLYCAEYNTKGRVVAAAIRFAGAKPKQVDELVNARLWDENGSGYVVHDFEDYNGERAQARERKQRQRSREGHDDVSF